MYSIKVVGIVTAVVFCFIYLVTNKKLVSEIWAIQNFKLGKIKLKDIFVILIMFILILVSIKVLLKSKQILDLEAIVTKDQDENYDKCKEIANAQYFKHKELFEIETDIENCKKPYLPNNFKYVEGEWNTGYVIEDENGNQFVWVPCTNIKNNEEIPLLKKERFMADNAIYFDCYEQDNYEEFLSSCLENGGFYISRFEIGKEDDKPVSKKDVEVWTNVTWKKANNLAQSMYSDINSELINGYAVDTAVSFIVDKIDRNKICETTKKTGNQAIKNIYDLVDDMYEWSSELRYGSHIYRGSIFDENEMYFFADRYTSDSKMENLGFRTIIYR